MAAINGMTPGWYAPGTVPQGVLLNTPRNNSMAGGPQYYDPQYATMQATPQINQQLNGQLPSMARGYNGIKPGGGSGATGSNRGSTGLAWQQPTDIFSSNMGGFGNINTSIIPRAPYSPAQTLEATNQAVAAHQASGNMGDIMKRFDSPGVLRGAAHVARALPIASQANAAARRTRAQLPLEDFLANAQSITGGQSAREQEAIALAQLSLRNQGQQQQYRQGMANQQLQNLGTGFNMLDAFGLN